MFFFLPSPLTTTNFSLWLSLGGPKVSMFFVVFQMTFHYENSHKIIMRQFVITFVFLKERKKCRLRILFVPLKISLQEIARAHTHTDSFVWECVLCIHFQNLPTWANVAVRRRIQYAARTHTPTNRVKTTITTTACTLFVGGETKQKLHTKYLLLASLSPSKEWQTHTHTQ